MSISCAKVADNSQRVSGGLCGVIMAYAPYEGLNSTNQKGLYLAGSWREASHYFIAVLANIRENYDKFIHKYFPIV